MGVINFGSMNVDHVYSMPHFVQPGETLQSNAYNIYCGGKGFVHCGKCGKLSCWDEEEVSFSCYHCGHTGEIGMSADEFDDIKAGDY